MQTYPARIPDADVENFEVGFLYRHPIEQEDILDSEDNPTGEKQNKYTPKQWVVLMITRYAKRQAREGLRMKRRDNTAIPDGIKD